MYALWLSLAACFAPLSDRMFSRARAPDFKTQNHQHVQRASMAWEDQDLTNSEAILCDIKSGKKKQLILGNTYKSQQKLRI